MTRYAKIAVSLPPSDLADADRLAERLDRSRSWVIAEAVRRFVAESTAETLGASRMEQLRRDLALTAEQRVRAAEELAVVPAEGAPLAIEVPRRFASYDEFAEWRRRRFDG
jgi:metal-responsive CopG/Arc/MetJ family transcriptional regulator